MSEMQFHIEAAVAWQVTNNRIISQCREVLSIIWRAWLFSETSTYFNMCATNVLLSCAVSVCFCTNCSLITFFFLSNLWITRMAILTKCLTCVFRKWRLSSSITVFLFFTSRLNKRDLTGWQEVLPGWYWISDRLLFRCCWVCHLYFIFSPLTETAGPH